MTQADVDNPELSYLNSENGSRKVDCSQSISVEDVRQELSRDNNQPDLVQDPATRELEFVITGWKTVPDTWCSIRRDLGPREYPLILTTSHVGESHYVSIMIVSQEELGHGRSILATPCPFCGTPLVRNHHREANLCLQCNREIWLGDKPSRNSNDSQPGDDDYYQFIEWPSEMPGKEPARLVSFPVSCLRDDGTALLTNRCPQCGGHLILFEKKQPACLWCGKNFPLEKDAIRVAYRISLSGPEHSSVTFHKGRVSKTWRTS